MTGEPTDEVVMALWRELPSEVQDGREPDDIRPWVAAVLAIVERDRAAETAAVAEVLRAYRASRAKGFSWSRGQVAEALRALDRAAP